MVMRTITKKFRKRTEEFVCPVCGSEFFGAVNPSDPSKGYRCHDQFNIGCKRVGTKEEMFAVVITELIE